jgi:hypothetical protein
MSQGAAMRLVLICRAVTGMALLLSVQAAGAHGIAGNRFFVGMLTFDDPSVADEAIVPNFSTLLFFLDDLRGLRMTWLAAGPFCASIVQGRCVVLADLFRAAVVDMGASQP